jgi:hypothetical protein
MGQPYFFVSFFVLIGCSSEVSQFFFGN